MTRVDNAAIASQLLSEVEEILHGQPTSEPLVKATQAVAEATLALVEQQRIANLIAVATYDERSNLDQARGDGPVEITDEHPLFDEIVDRSRRIGRTFAEIREALDLS